MIVSTTTINKDTLTKEQFDDLKAKFGIFWADQIVSNLMYENVTAVKVTYNDINESIHLEAIKNEAQNG